MDVHVADSLEDLPFSHLEWDRLVAEDPRATVFQSRPWIEAWWASFGSSYRLSLLSLSEGGRLTGLLPLIQDKHVPQAPLQFLGQGQADYLDLIARSEDRVRGLEAALARMTREPGWTELQLHNIPGDSETARALPMLCDRLGLWPLRGDDEVCPTLCRDGPEPTPATLLQKYRVRRATRYFSRQGRLAVRDLSDPLEARAHLSRFFEQHVRRWQGTPTPSLFDRPEKRAFYERLMESLLPAGHLLFTVAELDDEPIAYHFGFDFKDRVIWYKPSFEPRLARHSPGTILIEHLLRHVVSNNRLELDFTIGAEAFKDRYCNLRRSNAQFRLFRTSAQYHRARALDLGYRGARAVVRRLGIAPWLRGRYPR